MTPRSLAFSRSALVGMTALLAVYVVLHSPLRDAVSTMLLGRTAHTSYFASIVDPGPGAFAAFTALFAILAALAAAASIADRSGCRTYEWPVVFGTTAFGAIAIPGALLGGLGALLHTGLLRPPLGPALVSLPAVIVATHALSSGWRPRLTRPLRTGRPGAAVVAGVALLLLAASALIAVSQPPTGFDALAYHGPLAVYLWRDGDLVSYLNRSVSGFALAHTASAELWFGLLLLAGGERLANLGQLPFALLGACAVGALARRLGARTTSATLAGSAFLLAPIVALQSGMQLNDVVAAALVLAAAALACAPLRDWTRRRSALAGLALGLAVTTKVAVVPAAGAVLLFCVVRLWSNHSLRRSSAAWLMTAVLLLPFALTVSPWWTRNVIRYGNPLYPAALPLLGGGIVNHDLAVKDSNFVPRRPAWPLYPLIEPLNDQSGFGPLLIMAAVPGIVVALTRRRRTPVLLFTAVAACTLPAWWTQAMHEPRHLLVVAGMAFAFIPSALALGTSFARRSAWNLAVGAALFSAVVTADQGLVPRAQQQLERLRFYDVVWNVDPAVAAAPESIPLLYNTGYASLSYAGDYALLGEEQRRVLVTIDTDATTDSIVRTMRAANVRYAYVPASPAAQAEVVGKYATTWFTLDHVSEVEHGERAGTRRYLFRLRDDARTAGMTPAEPSDAGHPISWLGHTAEAQ